MSVVGCLTLAGKFPAIATQLGSPGYLECAKNSGYNLLTATVAPTPAQLKTFCSDAKCKVVFSAINAAGIPECKTSSGIMFKAEILNKLTCLSSGGATKDPAATDAPTDAPGTKDPSATDAPTDAPATKDPVKSDAPSLTPPKTKTNPPTPTKPANSGVSITSLSAVVALASAAIVSALF